ncbi:lipid-binding protein [Dyadobacter luteus]|uniref:Lipid-binding protein n=2 Tax=Dyadobacter luteus TaxID=2259619 RepID=A0A3D8Y965_9BACT|nr:lipid-binding protein [Dyadobacter luteus]
MLFFLLQCGNMVSAQSDWRLIAEDEGISVFSKSVSTSKVKAVKVECTLEASASQLVTLLMDLPVAIQWVSHTKSCTLVKRISPSELYYYSEVALPWPLENRDFVAHVRVTQDAITKVVTMNAPAVPGWVNENKGVVRIRKSLGYWTITPLAGNKVQVQYTLQVDPGGIIPAWMVNMLAAQGPMESFKNMRQQIRLPRYHNVSLPFITN